MSGFTTLARAFSSNQGPSPVRGYLIPLDGFNNDSQMTDLQRSFQYFPSTISDSQPPNYQPKIIPGLSHPLYQWTSGGARTISFEAIFSRDRTYTDSEQSAINSGASLLSNGFGSIPVGSSDDTRNVDIPSAVAWLRSFLLPDYSSNGKGLKGGAPNRPHPPQKVILGMPGVRLNWGVPSLQPDEVYAIMTGCDVVYEGFFQDGTPRMAKVALAFAEIIQVGGSIVVQDSGDKRNFGMGGYGLGKTNKKP